VEIAGNSPPPAPKYPVGGDQPKVNAGSPTYPLDVSAALSSDRKSMTIAVVNPTESVQTMDVAIKGIELRGNGRVWRMTGTDLNAITALTRHEVHVTETPLSAMPASIQAEPISIALYQFETRP
jgi:alpha-N-arabinofuranosidase